MVVHRKLTACMAESLKCFEIANSAGNDDLDARSKLKEHAYGCDQSRYCNLVVRLHWWSACNSQETIVATYDIGTYHDVVRMLLKIVRDPGRSKSMTPA